MVLKENRGFTLPELLVVMGIFVIVIMITANSFKTVANQVSQQSKGIETQIGSIVGLELLRSDLQNTGYGLPWSFQAAPDSTYTEVTTGDGSGGAMPFGAGFWPTGVSPISFNDAPNGVPRAVQSIDTTFNQDPDTKIGSKYLVIKSLSVAPGNTQKKFATITYGDTGRNPLTLLGSSERDFNPAGTTPAERVIVVRNTFVDGIPNRQLQVMPPGAGAGTFSTTFNPVSGFGGYTTLTQPHSSGDVFQVYGVDAASSLRMPFNRADYYVRSTTPMPAACAPNTGVLYKAIVNQGGGYREIPLLDCVADMQVAYGTGPAGTAEVNYHPPNPVPPDPALKGMSATDIRQQLKEIRVYILAHEGKMDPSFTYPSPTIDVGEDFGAGIVGRTFHLDTLIGDPAYKHYRWKVYTIVVRPKNLIQ